MKVICPTIIDLLIIILSVYATKLGHGLRLHGSVIRSVSSESGQATQKYGSF